ncbi:general stress protein [Natranaerofaba carboxydovora]|uniref:general stress protein n=1 Tax=Natranaerofaba carboxydovora TaxID=2742683 RepID=UPI001F13CC9A|nr:general stress protein [Natranaerofaba carboxydovora]UMZ73422.1 Heat induced stress protein YflT [Natranaerofaba carboxydovora]
MNRTVVGIFASNEEAKSAVNSLRENGFGDNEISLIARDNRQQEGDQTTDAGASYDNQNLGDGTATGGVLGGLAGLLAGVGALVIPGIGPIIAAGPIAGVLTGAVAGGIAGGLIDYGIPEEQGQMYESRVREGDVLLLIETSEQKADDAERVLRQENADEVESYNQD